MVLASQENIKEPDTKKPGETIKSIKPKSDPVAKKTPTNQGVTDQIKNYINTKATKSDSELILQNILTKFPDLKQKIK